MWLSPMYRKYLLIVVGFLFIGIFTALSTGAKASTSKGLVQETLKSCSLKDASAPNPENSHNNEDDIPAAINSTDLEGMIAKYYASMASGDVISFSQMHSAQSFMFFNTSPELLQEIVREDHKVNDLSTTNYYDFNVLSVHEIDTRTILVSVRFKSKFADYEHTQEAQFILRREGGKWKINLQMDDDEKKGLFIDYIDLSVKEKTLHNVTIRPLRIVRYLNLTQLLFCIDNNNNRSLVWGFGQNIAATVDFHGDKQDIVNTILFDRKRIYPDAYVNIPGMADQYPTKLELRAWQFANPAARNLPENPYSMWDYSFDLAN
jgi:hypothetical protein